MKSRGEAATIVLITLAAAGLIAWFVPKLWHKNTRNAEASTQATEQVDTAMRDRLAANIAKAASAAAGVATIGRATSDLPASPATEFVRAEVPAVLAKLPAPDPAALLEAEKRRVAVMEGKLQLAQKLYQEEGDRAAKLERDLAEKQHALEKAMEERRAVDTRLVATAAAQVAQSRQKWIFVGTTIVALALGLWIKLNGISIGTLGMMAADIRMGEQPMEVVNRYVPVRLWPKVNRKARLHTDLPDKSASQPPRA
ncbi:MAG: hypothetical protein JSS23_12295 [Proteobacteria bacterium]|nr:hypothetical protein [Pseudomonadota bacterium]